MKKAKESKKYSIKVEISDGGSWTAQIVRQVSKTKTHVSKQQDGFNSEAEANTWAEQTLSEFVSTQQQANSRQGQQRKVGDETKKQRSERRSIKTQAAKEAGAKAEAEAEESLEIDPAD